LIYSELLSGQNLLVYFAAALVPMSAWVFYRTRFGLRLRAVGENPHAVDTAGISVNGLRYQAVIISGVLCGVAGTCSVDGGQLGLRARHDGGQGLPRVGGVDFREMETGADAGRMSAVCIHRRTGDPVAGRGVARGRA